MATMSIDVNDMVSVNAAAFRVLSDNLGDDATAAFISQYQRPSCIRSDTVHKRPRLTATQIADALEYGKAESARLNASVTEHGDYTRERHERPSRTNEEVWEDIQRLQAEAIARGEVRVE